MKTDQYSEWLMLGIGAQNYAGQTDSVSVESVRFYAPNACSQPCQNNGTCVGVDQCICLPGWTGQFCEQAICTNPCNPIGGNCTAPDTCSCFYGWTDNLCHTRKSFIIKISISFSLFLPAVCVDPCINGGNCTGPDTCTCDEIDWTGRTCSQRKP